MTRTALDGDQVTRRRTWTALWLIVLAGLALRVWFGSLRLDPNRFWDERYSLMNVRAVYETGELVPVNAYYPSPVFSLPQAALWRASDALHARTGRPAFRIVDARGRLTPTGYLTSRLVQAVYGTAAIVFTFLIGRAMFSSRVALVAALPVAFSPWPVHASGYVKPDALLMMTIALAFWATVLAVDKPTVGRHVSAGVAIALAMSSKLTGGTIALCLALAALVLGWRDRRRWALLAVAGASSALAFVAFNPYWRYYLGFLEGLKRDYLLRAELADSTRAAMPGQVVGFVTGEYLHGVLLGALSLAALGWLAIRALRRREAGLESVRLGMFVVFPLAYTAIYVVQTPYFKPNNFLPLVPFTSVAAAWMLVGGLGRMAGRWPPLGRQPALAAAFLILATWQASRGFLYVYRSYTPTNRDAALDFLNKRLNPPHARLVYAEDWDETEPPWISSTTLRFGRDLSAIQHAERLDVWQPQELSLSDGLYFPERRFSGPGAAFYRSLVAGVPEQRVHVFRSAPFERRGAAVVVVFHGPRRLEPIVDLEPRPCPEGDAFAGGCLAMDLPADPAPDETGNLYLYLTSELLGSREVPGVELGERRIDLVHVSPQRGGNLFLTPRFRLGGSAPEIRLRRETAFGDGELKVQLFRWSSSY